MKKRTVLWRFLTTKLPWYGDWRLIDLIPILVIGIVLDLFFLNNWTLFVWIGLAIISGLLTSHFIHSHEDGDDEDIR